MGAGRPRRRGGPTEPGGWFLHDEPELHLADDVLVPDIAGWRRERMPEMPDVPFFTLAPDWVCEVLSPATARYDRGGKLSAYRRAGVGQIWIIDPPAQTLEIFAAADGLQLTVFSGDARVRAAPFEAIELDLARLWIRR